MSFSAVIVAAGASVRAGPGLPGDIVSGMSRFAAREGLASIRDIRDSATERWAEARLD